MNPDPLSGAAIAAMLLLQLALIGVNAFFAATELAVMQLNANKLKKQAEEGDRYAPRLLKLVEHPSTFLSTIQIGITLAGFLASAFAADNFAGPVSRWLYNDVGFTALSMMALNTITIIIITLVLAFFTLVLGELVPKQVALHRPYRVARFAAGIINALSVVLRPLTWLLNATTALVLRLFGIKGERAEETVTEEEIRMLVDAGHENGTIDEEEKTMIDNVFELDNLIARDVMTHRVDVVAIEADAEPDEVVHIIAQSGKSRFPVYDDSYDDILGVLNARSYLLGLREKPPTTVRELLRPACFVPETVPADVLLRDMQVRQDHLAIVVDEYGGFAGIVTMEDLIEEIVGNIYDEFDAPDEPDILPTGPDTWRIAGDTDIEDIEKALGITLPEDREYDSLGGLIFSQFSSIPSDGKRIDVELFGLYIRTEPIVDHHVEWAEVTKLAPPPPEEEDEKEKHEKNRDK